MPSRPVTVELLTAAEAERRQRRAEWGQRVCAADASVGEESLRAAASAHLAPYKRPKSYFPATDLPRTVTGKLVRRDVAGHLGLAGG
jgi:acyl-CoA synthetase (AMP-forming)/AMP-acid ligase II